MRWIHSVVGCVSGQAASGVCAGQSPREKEYGIYRFKDMKEGWSRKVLAGKRGAKSEPEALATELPMISRHGTNNGFWVHSGHLWWSNEDTVLLKDHVDRRSIKELLKNAPK